MVAKLAVAFFPKSTKEVSEDDTPHDERDESFWVREGWDCFYALQTPPLDFQKRAKISNK
jgi:hypothetical protein